MEKDDRGDAETQRGASPGMSTSLLWDDLRVFLACAEKGSFRAAAKQLGLNSATVARRIDRLENLLGSQVFNRLSEGIRLTVEGERIVQQSMVMERASYTILGQRQIKTEGLRGVVNVAITEGLGTYWMLPRLLEFQKQNRLLTIEMQCTMLPTDVGRLQADISIQFVPEGRADLITARLGYLHIYPFASKSYVQQFGLPSSIEDLHRHRIIKQIGPLLGEGTREMGLESLEGVVGFRTNGSTAVLYAVERDAGIAFLPSYASTLAPDLVPLDLKLSRRLDIWMTYHPNLKQSRVHMGVVEWLRMIFDGRRFPCFAEGFIHPRDLTSLMSDSVRINDISGYAATTLVGDTSADEAPCRA